MDIRLNHKDITKAGKDSVERKSDNISFDSDFEFADKIEEVSADIFDKIKFVRRKLLTRISKLVNKPSKVCFSTDSPRARDAFHRF